MLYLPRNNYKIRGIDIDFRFKHIVDQCFHHFIKLKPMQFSTVFVFARILKTNISPPYWTWHKYASSYLF